LVLIIQIDALTDQTTERLHAHVDAPQVSVERPPGHHGAGEVTAILLPLTDEQ
jgi:hypothetical protein